MDTTENYSLGTKLRADSCLYLFAFTLLNYDHLLTFDDEVEFIWSRPNHFSSRLFFVNRYFSFVGNIVILLSMFFAPSGQSSCHPWEEFQEFFHAFAQIIVATLLTMRVYALYARDRRVLIVLTGIIVFGIGATIISLVFSESTPAPSLFPIGCHDILDLKNAACKPLIHLNLNARLQPRVKQLEKFSVFTIIVRDGSIYFGIMALANLVNVLTFYVSLDFLYKLQYSDPSRYTIPLRQLHVCYSYVALDAASSQNHESRPICMVWGYSSTTSRLIHTRWKITTPKKVSTTQEIFRKIPQVRAIPVEYRVLRRLTSKSWRFERKAVMHCMIRLVSTVKYTGIASDNQACVCIGPANIDLEAPLLRSLRENGETQILVNGYPIRLSPSI
ncbi:hypothetical protein C8R41DRAFT_871174 [Lentinula lateritia]|uniref:DUF6533 domain-containing protein n=1 Tax=Lentinula lateritia TaxID=40482 RepID=A0ABQ8V4K2_9AGAR|nr:hypothetical protein C8R41DRAFT_871174 [Lentinula lateritia]